MSRGNVLESRFCKVHLLNTGERKKQDMETNKKYLRLLRLGFTQAQIEHLCYLQNTYAEREQVRNERRHLEFARWLVSTGRLTDEFPEKRAL